MSGAAKLRQVVCAMGGFGIERSAYYFPEQRYSVEQWAELLNQPAELIAGLRESGMRHYHVAVEQSPLELAWQAASRCCAGLDGNSIDALIVVSTLGCSRPPAPMMLHEELRKRLGMRAQSLCLTLVDMHCASMMGAIEVAHRLLLRHPQWSRILIVSVDKMYEEWARNIGRHAIQSDGAAALLLQRDAALSRLDGMALRVEPQFADGFLKPPELQRQYWENYQMHAFSVLTSLLARLRIEFGDVDAFLFPNMNPAPYAALAKAVGVETDRLFGATTCVPRHGHANCSDFVVNLTQWLHGERTAPQRVVAYASGTTGFFCALALTALPDRVNGAASSFPAEPPFLSV